MKTCSTCGEIKHADQFHNNKNTRDKKSSRCKVCAIGAAEIYVSENYDRVIHNKRKRREDLKYSLRESAKSRASILNVPFDLDENDIIIPTHCPVLGLLLEKSKSGKATANSPSLDRIVPEKGYVRGNVIVMSYKANAMKSNATIGELRMFAGWVLRNFKG